MDQVQSIGGWSESPLALRALLAEAEGALHLDPTRAKRCIADAVQLLTHFAPVAAAPTLREGGLAPWQMKKVSALVEAQLAGRLTTGDLAAAVRLSPGHFTRAFKKSFGEAPHAYAMRRRIVRSKHMMLTSDAPLAEIALDCGLADQAHFSRLFRKLEGEAPAAWRRRNHQD